MDDFEKLINASDLIDWIMETYPDWCVGATRGIVDHINELPSAQPERKKGEWIIHNVLGFNCRRTNRYFAECSECGTLTREWRGNLFPPSLLRFCTNCGAYMRGENK